MSAASNDVGGGLEHLRRVLYTKMRKGHLAAYARDMKLGVSALEDFARGQIKTLSPDAMQTLAAFLLEARYDSATDLLHRLKPPAAAIPLAPGYPRTLAETGWKKPTNLAPPPARPPAKETATMSGRLPLRPGWAD